MAVRVASRFSPALPDGQVAALLLDRMAVLILGMIMGALILRAYLPDGPVRGPAPAVLATPAPAGEPPRLPVAAAAPARVLGDLAAGRPLQVGVFGDSYGDGLWSGLLKLMPAKDGWELHRFSRPSTGFTRYRSVNLEEATAAVVAAEPVDVAVVSFGANDTFALSENGRWSPYMSPAWKETVSRRAAGLVAVLRRRGAMVYWVGLPRMRKPEFDGQVRAMNAFYAELMGRLQVPFVPTEELSVDGAGGYADYLPDVAGAAPRLMRAGDGVHMSMQGYVHISRPLAARIAEDVKAARASVHPAAVPAAR